MKLYLLLLFCSVLASSLCLDALDELELEDELENAVKEDARRSGNAGARRALMAKLREAEQNCRGENKTVPCPVCGSDRNIYWNGTCELWESSCANGGTVFAVRMRACLRKNRPIPSSPMFSEFCGLQNDAAVTLTRCDWKPKSCRDESDTTTKMVHPGQCGNCTEGNVCPAMVGRMRRWRQCDFSSRCEFLIARCEQFKNDGTVLVKQRCNATTTPEPAGEVTTTAEPAGEVTTTAEPAGEVITTAEPADEDILKDLMQDPKKGGRKGGRKKLIVSRDVIKKFFKQRKACRKDKNITCPVCGSDRVIYWDGGCDLRNKTCAAGESVYMVRPRYCFIDKPVPANRFPSEICVKEGNATVTLNRMCAATPKKCGGSGFPKGMKMVHTGVCGNCTEANVCTKALKRKLRRCPLIESRCQFMVERCEQFQADGTIKRFRCREKKTTTPAPTTTAAPVITSTAAPVITSTAAPVITSTAAPVITSTAAPVITSTAAPVITSTAAPVITSTVAPVITSTVAPETTTEAPETTTEAPETTTEAPETTTEAPETTTEAPETTTEAPETTTEAPETTTEAPETTTEAPETTTEAPETTTEAPETTTEAPETTTEAPETTTEAPETTTEAPETTTEAPETVGPPPEDELDDVLMALDDVELDKLWS